MLPARQVIAFFAKVILLYALLRISWPAVQGVYRAAFCASGTFVFRPFGVGRVQFEPLPTPPAGRDPYDAQAVLENVRTRARGTMPMNSRLMGYLPTAFVAALIVATPVGWRRRAWGLLAGVAVMSGFAGFELWLRLLDAFSDASTLAQYTFPPWGRSFLLVVLKVIGMSPVTAYITPIFIWVLLMFRREDWNRILDQAPMSLKKHL